MEWLFKKEDKQQAQFDAAEDAVKDGGGDDDDDGCSDGDGVW